jgi:UDP-N-acetyl-D-glucosamine dehydrogenase
VENPANTLLRRIETRSAKICIVGLGYVGVPLSVASAEAGFQVAGVDVDKGKVEKINSGICYVEDAYSERLLPSLVKQGKIHASNNLKDEAEKADVVIICVPTPLNDEEEPDLSYVKSVARNLSSSLSNYKLVILESTSYPGTTNDVVKPLLEKGGRVASKDFALVYSPERIDYGNPKYSVKDISKVVGGVDPESTRLGAAFYETILKAPVVKVSSPSVAEAAKILENIFRYVNIGLVNELSVLHEELGVDFIEAIGAAATKPFGFMAHYPGPGIGGHCIPKDPFYLVYRAKKLGLPLRLVSAAEQVNKMMPRHVVSRLMEALDKTKRPAGQRTVALWGLAYKGEVKDTRRSPALDILKLLQKQNLQVKVYDPYVPEVSVGGRVYKSASSAEESVRDAEAVLVLTNHQVFTLVKPSTVARAMKPHAVLFDTKNLLSRDEWERAGFTYLATGKP